MRWATSKDATLALMGVLLPQRQQVERSYPGGIAQFIQDRLEAVFTRIPLHDNYFWRVYLTGQYTPDCCPEYLQAEDNFHRPQGLLWSTASRCIPARCWNSSERYPKPPRFVLLDHMDWLSTRPHLLARQWQALVERAAPATRILWRSGALKVDYVDPIRVEFPGPASGRSATCCSIIRNSPKTSIARTASIPMAAFTSPI